MAEKLVMRISLLSTLLGGGKTTERLLVHISVAGRRRDQPGRGSKGKLVIRIWDRAIRGVNLVANSAAGMSRRQCGATSASLQLPDQRSKSDLRIEVSIHVITIRLNAPSCA